MLLETPERDGGENSEEVARLHCQSTLPKSRQHAAHENEEKILPRDGGKNTAGLAGFLLSKTLV